MAGATKRIQVMKTGTFTAMNGQVASFTADDLRAIAASYDPVKNPIPIVVGHPKHNSPAFGWVQKFSVDGDVLCAEADQMHPGFVDAVKAGTYKKVSMAFHTPNAPANPKPGALYPQHLGFLGGAAPAVPGLEPVQFASDEANTLTLEFSDAAFRDVASLFRSVRDHLIEREGLEVADRVLPEWSIRWIDDAGRQDDQDDAARAFAAQQKDNTMTDLAQREAALAAREADIRRREQEAVNRDNLAFAEQMISEGRVLPASKGKIVGLLNSLSIESSLAFAADDGQQVKAVDALRDILKAQPPVVSFGKVDKGEGGAHSVAFAAPAGAEVSKDGLETLGRAQAYQKANPTVSLIEAVKAIS